MASQVQKRYICVAFCFRWILRVHGRRQREASVPRQPRDHPTPGPDPLPVLLVLCVWTPRSVLPSPSPRARSTACPFGSMYMVIQGQIHCPSFWFYVYWLQSQFSPHCTPGPDPLPVRLVWASSISIRPPLWGHLFDQRFLRWRRKKKLKRGNEMDILQYVTKCFWQEKGGGHQQNSREANISLYSDTSNLRTHLW